MCCVVCDVLIRMSPLVGGCTNPAPALKSSCRSIKSLAPAGIREICRHHRDHQLAKKLAGAATYAISLHCFGLDMDCSTTPDDFCLDSNAAETFETLSLRPSF